MEPWTMHEHQADGLRVRYADLGRGDPVVLLHGWPQTMREWHEVVPLLGNRRVIMPNLRGVGGSAAPERGFSKADMAQDIVSLLDALRVDACDLVGHDWGGPVAFRVACAMSNRIRSLAIVDVVIPGDGRPGGMAQGGQRWHHAFHRTDGLPEALTFGRETVYLRWFLNEYAERPDAITPDARAAYVSAYAAPGAMRAGFEWYRAAERDAADNAAWLAQHGRLLIPVLGVSGGAGRGRGLETEASLTAVAKNVECHVIEGCGHLVPEEAPDRLAVLLEDFWHRLPPLSPR